MLPPTLPHAISILAQPPTLANRAPYHGQCTGPKPLACDQGAGRACMGCCCHASLQQGRQRLLSAAAAWPTSHLTQNCREKGGRPAHMQPASNQTLHSQACGVRFEVLQGTFQGTKCRPSSRPFCAATSVRQSCACSCCSNKDLPTPCVHVGVLWVSAAVCCYTFWGTQCIRSPCSGGTAQFKLACCKERAQANPGGYAHNNLNASW